MNERTKIIPPDQPQRALIETCLEFNLLVEAAAGTGKTTGMVARMAALISSGRCRPENLAAVTFTRKAAGELRTRFQRKLEELAADQSFAGRGEPAFREA
ncbi:MAG: UvrD-helicase domain-containing protein, partial [Candidatus Glassbacteria bacterium]